jgi:chromosome segregation ATPase
VTDDIVTRLHDRLDSVVFVPDRDDLIDAADEIERLREQSDGWQATAAGLSEDISNAEDEIERLRAAGDALAERLRWWTDDTDQAYPDHEALRTWEQVARG